MRAFQEQRRTLPEGQSFNAFRHSASSFPFAWHYHPWFELTLIESGEGTRFVGDSILRFAPGDLVLLSPNLPHTWSSESKVSGNNSHRAIVVHFPGNLFESEAHEFRLIQRLLATSGRGLSFPRANTRQLQGRLRRLPTLKGLDAWCELARLLNDLSQSREPVPLASSGYTPQVRQGAQRRLNRVLSFIESKAGMGTLRMDEVARIVHMSPSAFSRFFRQKTGHTLVGCINSTRVGRACQLLTDSDKGIAEIAYACGFENLSNFNRRFREIKGMTPSMFRSRFAQNGSRA